MTDKTEGPGKDAGRASEGQMPKRPHATLDLKATEIKQPNPTPTPEQAAAAAAASSAAASSSSAPSDTVKAAEATASEARSGGAKPVATEAPKGASASAQSKAAAAPAAARPPAKPAATSDGSGFGRFLSLIAAGAIGGGLVYAGTAWLGPQSGLGLFAGAGADKTAQLDARLAALEADAHSAPLPSQLAAHINDAQARIGKLEALSTSVAALSATQQKLADDAKSLSDKVAQDPGQQLGDRVGKLEERLDLIATGAPSPDGRVPQLVAITGKISDLEAALSTQIAQLRKSMPQDMDSRIETAGEAAEAAKAGTQRVDRELAAARTETARLVQRVEASKADTDRLQAALQAVQEDAGKLSSAVGELKGTLESQLKGVAKPGDVSAAIAPVTTKVTALEQSISGIIKGEDDRKINAERIVLSLELSNLKRALDRGQGYATELAEVKKAAAGRIDLAPLERFKDVGVATQAELESEFRPVMNAVLDADTDAADGSVVDRLLSGARSIVRVRKVGQDDSDTSTEAIVARIEAALKDGRLGAVLEQARGLQPRALGPMQDWLDKVSARHSVDNAMAAVETQLKSSLSGASDPSAAKPADKAVN